LEILFGDSPSAGTKDFDDKGWRDLDWPHDWSIEGKTGSEELNWWRRRLFPAGIGWYRKKIDVPAAWKGKCISIYFEGVYMNFRGIYYGKSYLVYIHMAIQHSVTTLLLPGFWQGKCTFGKSRQFSKADNTAAGYSGSGIYRHVWMIVTNPLHVATWGVNITTPQVSGEKADS